MHVALSSQGGPVAEAGLVGAGSQRRKTMPDITELAKVDILALDYDGKVRLLERVAMEMLDVKLEYAKVAGKAAELGAVLLVLREVKSALQTAIKAEGN